MKSLKLIVVLILVPVIFVAGIMWEKHRVLESGPLQLISPLKLTGENGSSGQLPEGTVLYPYSHGPSINTYVVFINTKHMNLLKPITFDNYLTVSPIEGYGE